MASVINAVSARSIMQDANIARHLNKWQRKITKHAKQGKCKFITKQYIPSQVIDALKQSGFFVDSYEPDGPDKTTKTMISW